MKTLPRWDFVGRRASPKALLDPLPALTPAEVTSSKAAKNHEKVAARYRAAQQELAELRLRLVQAQREDEQRKRDAARESKPFDDDPRTAKVERQIAEQEERLRLLGDDVLESAHDLLAVRSGARRPCAAGVRRS